MDLNQSIVCFKPSASGILGSQSSRSLASVMSGRRRVGSSAGNGRLTNLLDEPVNSITCSANSRMVNSVGLPMLTGPVKSSTFIMRMIASTKSSR